MAYLEPDYYEHFACKQGRCRTSCCEGWPITISLKDYYRLLSLDCPSDLRAKLDCALHILDNPTDEEYAQLLPNFFGNCPMHLDDGRCALHAALGEAALPLVCRQYPRSIRRAPVAERCCANSCEAVLDMFLTRAEPIRFTGETANEKSLSVIHALQERRLPLPHRILALSGIEPLGRGLTREELLWGMQVAERLLGIADEHSASVNAYGSLILGRQPQAERAVDRYNEAKAHFVQIVPQWETFFEHMLVNHVFFKGATDPLHGFAALCAIYALLRLLGMSWMSDKSDTDALIDVCAAAFHLFDHTSFGQYAADMLRDLGAENGCGVLLAL